MPFLPSASYARFGTLSSIACAHTLMNALIDLDLCIDYSDCTKHYARAFIRNGARGQVVLKLLSAFSSIDLDAEINS